MIQKTIFLRLGRLGILQSMRKMLQEAFWNPDPDLLLEMGIGDIEIIFGFVLLKIYRLISRVSLSCIRQLICRFVKLLLSFARDSGYSNSYINKQNNGSKQHYFYLHSGKHANKNIKSKHFVRKIRKDIFVRRLRC